MCACERVSVFGMWACMQTQYGDRNASGISQTSCPGKSKGGGRSACMRVCVWKIQRGQKNSLQIAGRKNPAITEENSRRQKKNNNTRKSTRKPKKGKSHIYAHIHIYAIMQAAAITTITTKSIEC